MIRVRYISLFSGIEAASVAWEPLGWEPLAFAEIEPFPCAVLAERFPHVPNLGSVIDIGWSGYSDGSVDLIVGGSPCQSFSIAGKREGLQGESRLMFEYIRAVREVRPRYFVWENVPGAFSSEKGEAFRQLLSEMDGLGYGMAWRVLDAQFFGVAQRRRRVFLVGVLGDGAGAAEILLEPDSLRWDNPSSREKRQELAAAAQSRAGRSYTFVDRCGNNCKNGKGGCGVLMQDEVASTFATAFPQTLLQPCYGMSYKAGAKAQAYPVSEELHPTLSAYRHDASVCYAFAQNTRDEVRLVNGDGDIVGALAANPGMKQTSYICMADDNAKAAIDFDLCGSLKVGGSAPTVSDSYVVRRLTPRECERLQGFPDDWTLIDWKGKGLDKCPDAPRYKALGNSMAVPVMRWIGRRMAAYDVLHGRSE